MEEIPHIEGEPGATPDAIVIQDEAYWAEVRASIGRGTPNILLGT